MHLFRENIMKRSVSPVKLPVPRGEDKDELESSEEPLDVSEEMEELHLEGSPETGSPVGLGDVDPTDIDTSEGKLQ